MRHLLAVGLFLSASTVASQASWELEHKPLKGSYGIYGGDLGDPVAPSHQDSKIMFTIEGRSARDLFDAIGPDVKDACTEGSGSRVRMKDREKLSCLRTKEGEYYCNFGFDLKTGKSIGGSVC